MRLQAIIFYCYIIIFQGWILNLLHIPPEIAKLFIQCIDFFPFLILAFIFKLQKGLCILPNRTAFWVIILAFLLHSLTTTLLHGGRIAAAAIHFGAMFRYVPLATLIACLRLEEKDILLFLKHFKIISGLLVGIGFIELIGGPGIAQYFLPITEEYSPAIKMADETQEMDLLSYSIFGIFPNTVDYSFFLLLSYIFLSGNNKDNTNKLLLGFCYFILIFATGSKATLLIFLCVVSSQLSKYKAWLLTFFGIIIIASGILIYQFWDLFYWTVFIDSQSSRLGYIIFTFPDFLSEYSFDTFFGVSPDPALAWAKINSYANAPMMTWEIEHMTSFEDEFYVALPVYYGLLGFGLLLTFVIGLYRTLKRARWINNLMKYKYIIRSLFLCILIASLFNQILIIKPFSLFFWVIIGLITSQISQRYKCMGCNIVNP